MPAPISVIIPTLNVADQIGPCLSALSEALTEGLITEVIFADGGSNDATKQVADDIGATFLPCPKGRGNQLAAAADTARGDWLLFLHADSVLETGWTGDVRAWLKQKNAGYFNLKFDSTDPAAKIVGAWANFRSRAFTLPYGDQGLLIRAKQYHKVGGHPEIPLMEDVAIAKNLRGNLKPITVTITTSAEKYSKNGWFSQSFRNFFTLIQYKLGHDPKTLARRYTR